MEVSTRPQQTLRKGLTHKVVRFTSEVSVVGIDPTRSTPLTTLPNTKQDQPDGNLQFSRCLVQALDNGPIADDAGQALARVTRVGGTSAAQQVRHNPNEVWEGAACGVPLERTSNKEKQKKFPFQLHYFYIDDVASAHWRGGFGVRGVCCVRAVNCGTDPTTVMNHTAMVMLACSPDEVAVVSGSGRVRGGQVSGHSLSSAMDS